MSDSSFSTTYGCHNRPEFRPTFPVQAGWYMDGYTRTPRMESVRHVMSTDCQFTVSEAGRVDPKCDGCRHKRANA